MKGISPSTTDATVAVAILYHELLLRAFDRSTPFFDLALLRILLFSLAAGLLLFLILDLLPWKPARHAAHEAQAVIEVEGGPAAPLHAEQHRAQPQHHAPGDPGGGLPGQQIHWALSAFGAQAKYYTYEYTANVSIPHFGVVTSLRLELEYAVALPRYLSRP